VTGDPNPSGPAPRERLDSWKEIAAHLHRGPRTVQRWELEEGLPVHRLVHEKRGSIYAYKDDLDAWWEGRRVTLDRQIVLSGPTPLAQPELVSDRRNWRRVITRFQVPFLFAIAGLLLGGVWMSTANRAPANPAASVLTAYPGYEIQPSLSPDSTQVAFSWNGNQQDNFDIYVKQLGGGEPIRLTFDAARDDSPAWSPDGKSIAFARRLGDDALEIRVLPSHGGVERKLARFHPPDGDSSLDQRMSPRLVTWSPDGQWLVVSARLSNGDLSTLYRLPAAGGELQKLTSPGAGTHSNVTMGDTDPVVSRDGHNLAFVRRGALADDSLVLEGLTSGLTIGDQRERVLAQRSWIGSPAWTPDGRGLIFSSNQGGSFDLWTIPALGGRAQRLPVGEDGAFASVSGRRMVYARAVMDTNLWRMEITGDQKTSSPSPLIASTLVDLTPAYSRDGHRIAFMSERSGYTEIWISNADGSQPVQWTSFRGPTTMSPSWSPDDAHIAFVSSALGQPHIYTIETARPSQPVLVTSFASGDTMPVSWSQDGKWIYFTASNSGHDQVWKVPSGGGSATQLTVDGGFSAIESPGGKFLCYLRWDGKALWRRQLSDHKETELARGILRYNFAVGHSGVYFMRAEAAGQSVNYYEFASGKTRKLAVVTKPVHLGVAISPDERYFTYAQIDHEGSELMLVEGLR
jgi:Tol biopolymer transport system component